MPSRPGQSLRPRSFPTRLELHRAGSSPPAKTSHGIIVTMPGVPREMFRMWKEQALPRLQPLAGQQVIDSTIIKTIGIGESAAEEVLHDLVVAADPVVATYAKDDGVHVRVTAVGNDPAETRARRDRGAPRLHALLAQYIWGADDDTPHP